jgi:hypothetical protein
MAAEQEEQRVGHWPTHFVSAYSRAMKGPPGIPLVLDRSAL